MPYVHVVEVGVPLLLLAPLAMAAAHAITSDADGVPVRLTPPAPISEVSASDQWIGNEA